MTWNPKDISKFDKYDKEMKISVCRAAFEIEPDLPPHAGMFYFARTIGFPIPDKWKDMHPDMVPDMRTVVADESQIGIRITKGDHLGGRDIIDIMVYYPIENPKEPEFRLEETFSIKKLPLNEVMSELQRMKDRLIEQIGTKPI